MGNANGRRYPQPPATSEKQAESVNISRATNGFTVRCTHPPKKSGGKATDAVTYESPTETVFEDKAGLLAYLGKVL